MDGKSYLCPEDTQVDKLKETMIALDAVYSRMAECKASLKLLLVDACRDDVVPEGAQESADGAEPKRVRRCERKAAGGDPAFGQLCPGSDFLGGPGSEAWGVHALLAGGLKRKAVNYAGMVMVPRMKEVFSWGMTPLRKKSPQSVFVLARDCAGRCSGRRF